VIWCPELALGSIPVYFTQGKNQIKFPKAITDVLSEYYSIASYKSHESKIPQKILKRKDRKFKLSCVIAFIVDEGNVRDVVSVYSVNKELLIGVRQLVLDCGYRCSKIQFNKTANNHLFTLSTKDLKEFYRDVTKLSNEFPTCNLSFKEDSVKFILDRRKMKNPRDRKITEKRILDLLEHNKLSAQEISRLTNYAYCTIIHCLGRLLKESRVRRVKATNKTYIWVRE